MHKSKLHTFVLGATGAQSCFAGFGVVEETRVRALEKVWARSRPCLQMYVTMYKLKSVAPGMQSANNTDIKY